MLFVGFQNSWQPNQLGLPLVCRIPFFLLHYFPLFCRLLPLLCCPGCRFFPLAHDSIQNGGKARCLSPPLPLPFPAEFLWEPLSLTPTLTPRSSVLQKEGNRRHACTAELLPGVWCSLELWCQQQCSCSLSLFYCMAGGPVDIFCRLSQQLGKTESEHLPNLPSPIIPFSSAHELYSSHIR